MLFDGLVVAFLLDNYIQGFSESRISKIELTSQGREKTLRCQSQFMKVEFHLKIKLFLGPSKNQNQREIVEFFIEYFIE